MAFEKMLSGVESTNDSEDLFDTSKLGVVIDTRYLLFL